MKKACLIFLAILSTQNAIAKEEPKQTKKAIYPKVLIVGTGAAVGGAIASVPGAVVGGFISSLLVHKRMDVNEQPSDKAVKFLPETTSKNNQVITEPVKLTQVELAKKTQFNDLLIDFNFKTASSELDDRSQKRLDKLIELLDNDSELSVQLDGFADKRGDADYNLALSKERVHTVEKYLKSRGLQPERIKIAAHGKSESTQQDLDGFALDRRVTISVHSEKLIT